MVGTIDLAAQMGAGAMGGPLGATSVAGRAVPGLREETTERMHRLAEHARSCGLQALLIEPTPLRRKWPHTPDELRELLGLTAQTAVPWRVVLDLGHALMTPLYGAQADLQPWLTVSGERLHGLHLQQTDGQADRHWDFSQGGVIKLQDVHAALSAANLAGRPAVLEVFYPFVADDDAVWRTLSRSTILAKSVWDEARMHL